MATIPIRSDDDARDDSSRDVSRVTTRLEIPGRTLVKVVVATILTLVALWLVRSLAEVMLMIVLALLLAAVLSKPVGWLERKGVKRGLAAILSLAAIVLIVALVLAMVLPPLITQFGELFANLPRTTDDLRSKLSGNPRLYEAFVTEAEKLRSDPADLVTGVLQFGLGAASVGFALVLLLTLALYFLLDGQRVRAALLRLTSARYRSRVDETLTGIDDVVRGYFIGQAIVSSMFAAFTFLLLTILGVPYAAVFAALAFFLDAIPNIGATLAVVIPGLVALSQSVTTAVIVVVATMIYQQIENNVISPRVLSGKLKVPPVATLIAVLAGGKLLGIIGVILAIPLAGTLPVLERIWTRRKTQIADADRTPSERDDRPETGEVAA